MSILDNNITREEWINRIGTDNSKATYGYMIKKWDDYLASIHHTDKAVLAEFKKENQNPDTYVFLNRFIVYLTKQGLKRGTVHVTFAALRSWCAVNGIMFFNEYINRFCKLPKEIKEQKIPLTHDKIRELVHQSPTKRMKAILLCLMSSGMRISECLQIRECDINSSSNPVTIKIRASTTKTKEERTAYISQEAWSATRLLIGDSKSTDFVFIKGDKFNHSKLISFEVLFSRLRKQCGFTEKYDDDKNYHVNIHSFRAYFHTQATKVIDGDTAHALIGHRQYLDQYFRLSVKERAELYLKLEPYVVVSNEARQKVELEEKERQLMEMEDMNERMKKLEAKLSRKDLIDDSN